MMPKISLTRTSSIDALLTLKVEIADGQSYFVHHVYVGQSELSEIIAGLDKFKEELDGGVFTLRFGAFGREFAAGALEVQMRFRKSGKLFLQVQAQSEFCRFEDDDYASEASFQLLSEPVLLDHFIDGLCRLCEGSDALAELEAIGWN